MTKTVDSILHNAIILTMDAGFQVHEPGAIAIQAGKIEALGRESVILGEYTAGEIRDCSGKVLMPGLINSHTHVAMTLLRGLADDLRLDVWLLGYIMPVEREFVSPDFVRLGTRIACQELIRSGVTCFADMYYFEQHIAQATAESGLRAVCAQTVFKYPAPDARYYEESLDATREFIKTWKDHPLIVPAVGPHAPYTCTPEILQASAALAVEFNVPLHIHLAETALEAENSRREHGMPVIPYAKKQNIFDAKVIAAHCVHVDEGEIHTLLHHKAGVAHSPSSNLKLASGFAPVTRMLELGLDVGIGTDGPASNNDLDMFEEIRLAAFLAKSVTGDPTALPAPTALAMATRLGARALHLGDLVGSLEVGKRADLILVDIGRLHNSPRYKRDPNGVYAQLVYSTKSNDVSDVMVDGKWLMRDRQLLTLDTQGLIDEANEYARRIDIFLIQREKSVLTKLIAIGGASEEESFEVQVKVKISDPEPILETLNHPGIEILRQRHYHEYDTYFLFEGDQQGTLRHREDEFIETNNEIGRVRNRLTLIGPARERQFPSDVLLSRSRYLAPAVHSLRFYREYFKPSHEIYIEKDRSRWRVLFQGTEFFINIDRVIQPDMGSFLEIKSRTWSQRDAENKAVITTQLIEFLGISAESRLSSDYLGLVSDSR